MSCRELKPKNLKFIGHAEKMVFDLSLTGQWLMFCTPSNSAGIWLHGWILWLNLRRTNTDVLFSIWQRTGRSKTYTDMGCILRTTLSLVSCPATS